MTASHLHVERLTKRFAERTVLDGVDLLTQGGITAILGPNGAGKTTLLRCLATVLSPDSGTVTVDGLDPRREIERTEIRRRLGYQPQGLGLSIDATVFDTIDHVAVTKEVFDDRTRRCLVFDALDRVGLRDRARDRIEALSGGMRQRVGLAQAILGSPTLLVLDEPAAGLDPDERLRLREIIAERRRRSTIVLSTHLTDEAAIADTVVVLTHKTVAFTGSPQQLAACAAGCSWIQSAPPPPDVRASWLLAEGRHRCLGSPPSGAELVEPTIEDGYLMVQTAAPGPAE